MGWTSFNLKQPVKKWFIDMWESDTVKVLDIAIVKRNTLYAAVKDINTNEIFCAVYLIRWSNSYYNFSYKDMTEFSGPCVYECPKRIMNLLTELNDDNDPNGWARKWRESVNNYWNQKKIINSNNVLRTLNPISFTNGCQYQYFKKIGKDLFAGILIENEFSPVTRVRVNLSYHTIVQV